MSAPDEAAASGPAEPATASAHEPRPQASPPASAQGTVLPAAVAGGLALLIALAVDFTLVRPQVVGDVSRLRGELSEVRTRAEAATTTQAEALEKAREEMAAAKETVARSGKALEEALTRVRTLEESVARNEARVNQLGESLTRLSAERPKVEVDWSLAEVEFLVFTAQERLTMARDVLGAERMLASADRRLAALAEPALIPLREALASDLNDLAAVQLPDTTGLAIYLGDLGQRVTSLPLKPDPTRSLPGTPAAPDEGGEATAGEPSLFGQVWAELRALVVIRESAQIDLSALDPATHALIRESLRQELAAARLAVLRHDREQAYSAIDSAIALLREHFDAGSEAVAAAIRALGELRQKELRPAIPETLAAHAATQAALAARARTPAPDAAAVQP
jgi:uroporphyrin-III C-methyltransferase